MPIKFNIKTAGDFLKSMGASFNSKANQNLLDHIERSQKTYAQASAGLIERLRDVGCNIASLQELKSNGELGEVELACLVDELGKANYEPLVLDILALLRVPQSRHFLNRLIDFWDHNCDVEVRLSLLHVFEVSCLHSDMSKLEPVFASARDANTSLKRRASEVALVIQRRV